CDSWAADPAGRTRAWAADHDASHCLRCLVDGGAVQRVERVVWGTGAWGKGRVGGVAGAVCRLCGVAAEVDGRRGSGGAGGVLEAEPEGSAGGAGVARGLRAAGAAELCRGTDESGSG